MTTEPTMIETVRPELERLIAERRDRWRMGIVLFGTAVGLLVLALPMVFPSGATRILQVGGGACLLVVLLIGVRIIRITGESSSYRHDRIRYLQAYVAAHDASAAFSAKPRPRSRPGTPLPVTQPDTVR